MVSPQRIPADNEPDAVEEEPRPGAVGRTARKMLVGAVGGTVTAVGIVLMPLPGPGTPVALAGLAILATEFDVARRQLDRIKRKAREVLRRTRGDDADGR